VLVAGDAAHQMPPFLGQGMCAGMRDAVNLAWKLGLVLRERADDALLDSYQRERAPHVRKVIEIAIAMGRIICTLDPQLAAARDAEMRGGAGRSDAQPTGMPDLVEGFLVPEPRLPLVGALGLQARVGDAEGREALLDDQVGPGFALLWHERAAPLRADAEALLARLGARRVVIGEKGTAATGAPDRAELAVDDLEGAYARWFASHGVSAALVRPDFTVCAAARTAEELSVQLEALAAVLGA
jgi:3-(3-hydroxy-phenyl)propionate hydroxylase